MQGQPQLSLLGWCIFLLLIYLASKSKTGYVLIYYALALILVLLMVSHYKRLQQIMLTAQGGTTA